MDLEESENKVITFCVIIILVGVLFIFLTASLQDPFV